MIFVCYSHEDEVWRKRFKRTVSPLCRHVGIECWSDKDIRNGRNWRDQIDQSMKRTSVAVLFVSDSFLDSNFIMNEELPFFLNATKQKRVELFWVLINPCMWKQTQIEPLQAFFVDELKPLIEMSESGWRRTFCERPLINSKLGINGLTRDNSKLQVWPSPLVSKPKFSCTQATRSGTHKRRLDQAQSQPTAGSVTQLLNLVPSLKS
jgi:hypothetical protein